jgi:hypothetical protein
VSNLRWTLWLAWLVYAAILAAELAVPYFVQPRPDPWNSAETAVAGFVLALFSLAAGQGTFAVRESLAGAPQVRLARFLVLWLLCVLIGLFGSVIAWGSASPAAATPYVVAAAVLLVLHAPRPRLLARLDAA